MKPERPSRFPLARRLGATLAVLGLALVAGVMFFATIAPPATARADQALRNFCDFTYASGHRVRAYTYRIEGSTYQTFWLQQARSDQWKREAIEQKEVTVTNCNPTR